MEPNFTLETKSGKTYPFIEENYPFSNVPPFAGVYVLIFRHREKAPPDKTFVMDLYKGQSINILDDMDRVMSTERLYNPPNGVIYLIEPNEEKRIEILNDLPNPPMP